jgi:hypothetical protein
MKLVIYAPPFEKTARNVLKCLRSRYDGPDTVYLPALEDLETYLRRPSHLGRLLVLMPKDRHELGALAALSYLMRDAGLILVLPEDEHGMNAQAHLLRPRFVTYNDYDPSHIIAVVDKLMETDSTLPMKAVHY